MIKLINEKNLNLTKNTFLFLQLGEIIKTRLFELDSK